MIPPADSPASVTLAGSPPNAATLSRVHSSAIVLSGPITRSTEECAQAEVARFVVGGFFAVPADSVRGSGDEGEEQSERYDTAGVYI